MFNIRGSDIQGELKGFESSYCFTLELLGAGFPLQDHGASDQECGGLGLGMRT